MKKTVYLVILSIITVICIIIGSIYHITGWIGSGLNGLSSFITGDGTVSSKYDSSRKTYSENIDAFDQIEIETKVMDITIKTGDTWHLEYDCIGFLEPDVDVKSGKFRLKQPSSIPRWHRNNNHCDMTLTIPSSATLNNIDITSDVGNITINNTSCKNLTIEADVGDITLGTCSSGTTDLEADVGNITASMSELGKSDIETDTGNIDISGCGFKDIDVYNDVGNINFSTDSSLDNYDIELASDIGSVRFNGIKQKKHFYQSASDTSVPYNINLETDLGNITFNTKQ